MAKLRLEIKSKSLLAQLLKEWDGKHIAYLKDIYENYANQASFSPLLMELYTQEPGLQTATTWLIKHHYDNNHVIPSALIDPLLFMAKELVYWEAKLHVLQLLPMLELRPEHIPYLEDFVRRCLTDKKTFVRAWAYQGMYEIAQFRSDFIPELKQLCAEALENERASVKARVRKVLEKLP